MSKYYERVVQLAVEEMKGQVQRKPSKEELDKYFRECGSPDFARSGFDNTVHWCGIFAAYVVRKAGVMVEFMMGKGFNIVPAGPVITRINIEPGKKYVEGMGPGDIAIRKDNSHHHFIFLEWVDTGKPQVMIPCVEGNYGGVGNPLLHKGARYKNSLDSVDHYYRIE